MVVYTRLSGIGVLALEIYALRLTRTKRRSPRCSVEQPKQLFCITTCCLFKEKCALNVANLAVSLQESTYSVNLLKYAMDSINMVLCFFDTTLAMLVAVKLFVLVDFLLAKRTETV